MSRVKYLIETEDYIPKGLGTVASVVRLGGYVIVGRYRTNKTTLKKILKAYVMGGKGRK